MYGKRDPMPCDASLRRRGQKEFYFVNTGPSASSQDPAGTRRFVRAHVGKWTWQQIKHTLPGTSVMHVETDFKPITGLSNCRDSDIPSNKEKAKEGIRYKSAIGSVSKKHNRRSPINTASAPDESPLRISCDSRDERQLSSRTKPTTILQKGNSDPFESLSITVTPKVNQVLSFFRDTYLPINYATQSTTYYRSFGAHQEWDDGIALLSTESSAQAFVTAFLSLLAKLNPNRTSLMESLISRGRSYATLRSHIQKSTNDDPAILHSILFLYATEIFAGNSAQATIHGQTLRAHLLENIQEGRYHIVTTSTLVRALYFDSYFALSNVTRPIFTIDDWVTVHLKERFHGMEDLLEPIQPLFLMDLDEAIDCEFLRHVFNRFRLIMWIWTTPTAVASEDPTDVSQWLLTNAHMLKSKLLSYYLDLQPLIDENMEHSDPPLVADVGIVYCIRSCLALGMLCFLSPFGGDPIIGGRPVLGISETLLFHLQNVFHKILGSVAMPEVPAECDRLSKYHNALLWALFTGAQAEQREPGCYDDSTNAWFNVAFKSFVKQIGLSTWDMVRSRLERFIYAEHLELDTSVWMPHDINQTTGGAPSVIK